MADGEADLHKAVDRLRRKEAEVPGRPEHPLVVPAQRRPWRHVTLTRASNGAEVRVSVGAVETIEVESFWPNSHATEPIIGTRIQLRSGEKLYVAEPEVEVVARLGQA